MKDVFSSVAATTALANRVVRQADRNTLVPVEALKSIVHPVCYELQKRGKLPRNQLRPLFDSLVAKLYDAENIIDIDTGTILKSKLSTQNRYNVRFIQCAATNDGRYMQFLGVDIMIDRHSIVVFINDTDFAISSHLLARYMQRGQKEVLQFLGTVVRAIKASSIVAICQSEKPVDSSIALPSRDGLLLGTISIYRPEKRYYPIKIIYDSTGSHLSIVEDHGLHPNTVVSAWMDTFIDRNSLSLKKQRVLDDLEAWEQRNHDGIDTYYQAAIFGGAHLSSDGEATTLRDQLKMAFEGCRGLIASPEWIDLSKQRRID